MHVRLEVLPFLSAVPAVAILALLVFRLLGMSWRRVVRLAIVTGLLLTIYLLYFFRDPERIPPNDPDAVLAGADGTIAGVVYLKSDEFARLCKDSGLQEQHIREFLEGDILRISIFLRLTDVHVNRAPIAGRALFLGYFPGRRLFTFQEKSSELNQHNSILISNERTRCLINQIVGPICRRVVYWLPKDGPADVRAGDRIGMMKFGSRLDMYLPANDVVACVQTGDRVQAGLTVVGRLKTGTPL